MYPSFCLLQDIQTKEIIGRGTKREGLYYVDDVVPGRAHLVHSSRNRNLQKVLLLHRRLGHASFGYLKHIVPDLFSGIEDSELKCEVCILAKSHRVSFPPSMNRRSSPFALVHSDVWGPSPVSTTSGIRWFVTFMDDCTRMTWLYMLKNKSEVCDVFRLFQQMVKTQYSIDIKVLRSDNGEEYIASELSRFLQDRGIIHQTTCPHTPQQNGVDERKNRHILETARALLIGASVPKRFWPEAVTYAVYVINRMPSRVVEFRTPLQVLTEHVPVVSTNTLTPRVFGCVAYVHIHKIHRSKLDPCALWCVFVGFASQQKGYKCYHPETRHMYVTMDVTFSESEYFYSSIPSHSDHQGENTSGDQVDLGWLEVPEDVICSSGGACVDDKDENGTPNFRQEIAENDMGLQLLPAETSAGFRQGPTEEAIIIQQPTAEPSTLKEEVPSAEPTSPSLSLDSATQCVYSEYP
ncbi:hypothetical protein EV1_036542 [Malus domestica]